MQWVLSGVRKQSLKLPWFSFEWDLFIIKNGLNCIKSNDLEQLDFYYNLKSIHYPLDLHEVRLLVTQNNFHFIQYRSNYLVQLQMRRIASFEHKHRYVCKFVWSSVTYLLTAVAYRIFKLSIDFSTKLITFVV